MKYRTKFGTELKASDKFCTSCSAPLVGKAISETVEQKKKNGTFRIVPFLFCLVLAMCMLLGGCTKTTAGTTTETDPSSVPEITQEPGIYSDEGVYLGPAPTETTIDYGDGKTRTAYVVYPLDYTDWDSVGSWSDEKISYGSGYGSYFELKGDIKNCYGVSISVQIDAKNGTGSTGFKLGISSDGEWTYGDYHTEETIDKGDSKLLRVYNYESGPIEGFVDATSSVVQGSFNYTSSLCGDLCLYFATEKDAEDYIRSIC